MYRVQVEFVWGPASDQDFEHAAAIYFNTILHYCKSGNFRATFIFALFTLQPGYAKIKARKICSFCA